MGAYAVGDVSFTVEAAAEQLVVNVKKAKSAVPSTAVAATDGSDRWTGTEDRTDVGLHRCGGCRVPRSS